MAEIRDELILEIDQALRQINQIEASLDRALAPIEVEVDVDERSTQELEATLREVERIAGRAATETQSIALSAGNAEANFEDMARALGISEDEARHLTSELLEAQAASNRVEDAARDVARQLGLSDAEADRLTASLRRADSAAEAINTNTGAMVSNFGSLRTAAAGVAAAFAAIGGAQLLGAAVRGANTAVQTFANLEDSINAVKVVFDEGADTVFEFGETVARSAGISELAFQQAVIPLGALLTNFGFNAREAADASTILVQRAADLASLLGGDVQTALAAINSALVGQVEPLRNYGGEISQARVEQLALNEGIIQTGEELDTASAIQARYQLILQDTAFAAGDFARTSEDFANAQRQVVAEAQAVVTTFGEALLPAFEALLQQAPAVLAFFESLAPALGETATEAAEAGAGLAAMVSGITLGLGQFPDALGGLVDVAQGISGIIDAIVTLDPTFAAVTAQMDQFNSRIENELVRIAAQSIPEAMKKGTDGLTAFGNSIAFLGRQSNSTELLRQSFDRLSLVAGVSGEELADVTRFLIENAEAASLDAEDISFLEGRLAELSGAATLNVEALRVQRDELERLGDLPTILIPVTGALQQLAQTSSGIVPVVTDAFFAVARAGDTLADDLDPFREATAQLEISAREFTENLREQVEQIAKFDVGLIQLRLAGFEDLADELAQQGPAAQQALTGFLQNLNRAAEAEALLEGQGTAATLRLQEELTAALSDPSIPATLRADLVRLIEEGGIDSPEVLQSIVDGAKAAAEQAKAAAAQALSPATGEFNIAGAEARKSFFDGLSTPVAGEVAGLQESMTSTLDSAIIRSSPPQLFVDAGADSGAAFWAGFEQADMSLKLPTAGVTGGITTPTAPGQTVGGGGFTYAPVINNPTVEDLETTLAKNDQLMGAVSWILNGNFKL